MTVSTTYTSFLVRLWREPETEPAGQSCGWRGEVEHIQGGQRWQFDDLDDLLAFLRQHVEALSSRPPATLGPDHSLGGSAP